MLVETNGQIETLEGEANHSSFQPRLYYPT